MPNGTRQDWDDSGVAAALDLRYQLDLPVLAAVKFGARWATQESDFHNYSYSGRPLTTNGLPLAAGSLERRSHEFTAGSHRNVAAQLDGMASPATRAATTCSRQRG